MPGRRKFISTSSAYRVLFIVLATVTSTLCIDTQIVICSYNLWNLMFSWEVRLRFIARMVEEVGCEVLVLQEVRSHKDESWSQARYLQRLLPKFRWLVTHSSGLSAKPPGFCWAGWEKEGLAVLSQWPLGSSVAQPLSILGGADMNSRVVVHVPIFIQPDVEVHVVAVHFSYDRQQQCQNAAEILRFIHVHQFSHVIVAGDFNVYEDFLGPVELFTDPMPSHQVNTRTHQCGRAAWSREQNGRQVFRDTWQSSHGKGLTGLTFSNMPSPGLVSRPDRVLVSDNIKVLQTWLHGNGSFYSQTHKSDVYQHRLWTLIKVAAASFLGYRGYSCFHDCGPHGSCRCGICVTGGNSKTCLIPECEECSTLTFLYFLLLVVTVVVLMMLGALAVLSILLVSSRSQRSKQYQVMGCACCLCQPDVVRSAMVTPRFMLGRILRQLGVGRIPPACLFFLTVVCLIMCFLLAANIFEKSLETAAAVMPEELFPSDHLMVKASLLVRPTSKVLTT